MSSEDQPQADKSEAKSDVGAVRRRPPFRRLVRDYEQYKWPVGTKFKKHENGDHLKVGEVLRSGQGNHVYYLQSPDGNWHFRPQANGNYCIFKGRVLRDNILKDATWCTGTFVNEGSFEVTTKKDGFAVYNVIQDTKKVIRRIRTDDKIERLQLTDDGTLELIKATPDGCGAVAWQSSDKPVNELWMTLSQAMNAGSFLVSLNKNFFLPLLRNGELSLQPNEPSQYDNSSSFIWGSGVVFEGSHSSPDDAKVCRTPAREDDDDDTIRLYLAALPRDNFISKSSLYVIDPEGKPILRVSDNYDAGLIPAYKLELLDTGELVLTGGRGDLRVAYWQRPAERRIGLRYGDYWFVEGAYLVPKIDLPEAYTKNYITLLESGKLEFKADGQEAVQFSATDPGNAPYRLLNGGFPERPGQPKAKGEPGLLYLYSDTDDKLTELNIPNAEPGKESKTKYVLRVEQVGDYAGKMVMWCEDDTNPDGYTVLWYYPW